MNKQEAIEKLQRQLESIDALKLMPRFTPEFNKWRRDTEVAIERFFGATTRHLKDFTTIWYGPIIAYSDTPDSVWEETYQRHLEDARSILKSLIQEIEEYWDDKEKESTQDALASIERLLNRFHLIARQLRARYDNRPTLSVEDEYDVQDLLHTLLIEHFDDIRHEEPTPSHAGSSSRMDFLLKEGEIVIEAKKTRKGLAAKEVGEQLLIDIEKYQSHPSCKTLICFVYDPEGRISNPKGLENDLNRVGKELVVKVIIAPKGL